MILLRKMAHWELANSALLLLSSSIHFDQEKTTQSKMVYRDLYCFITEHRDELEQQKCCIQQSCMPEGIQFQGFHVRVDANGLDHETTEACKDL